MFVVRRIFKGFITYLYYPMDTKGSFLGGKAAGPWS